jgi:hypothetical protein
MTTKCTRCSYNTSNGHEISQNIPLQSLQKYIWKLGLLVWKYTIRQPCTEFSSFQYWYTTRRAKFQCTSSVPWSMFVAWSNVSKARGELSYIGRNFELR